ncbi:MAG: hypothetical protein AAF701_08040, partial [Pseudomonadota bacterium]
KSNKIDVSGTKRMTATTTNRRYILAQRFYTSKDFETDFDNGKTGSELADDLKEKFIRFAKDTLPTVTLAVRDYHKRKAG